MSRPACESSESSEFNSILPNSSPGRAYLAVLELDGEAARRYLEASCTLSRALKPSRAALWLISSM